MKWVYCIERVFIYDCLFCVTDELGTVDLAIPLVCVFYVDW